MTDQIVITIGGILLMVIGLSLVVGGMLGMVAIEWLQASLRRVWRRENRGPRDPFV